MPVEIDHCVFVANHVEDHGGAIYAESGMPRITNCLFVGNSAAQGGAVYLSHGLERLEFCTFVDNHAEDGGAIYSQNAFAYSLARCTFAYNEAPRGSGITLLTSTAPAIVIDATILSFGVGGEGIYWDGTSAIEFTSCDIHGNEGGDWTGAIVGQLGVNGNIDTDPMYCDPMDHVFTLMSASPCLPENNPEGVQIGAHGLGCETPTGLTASVPGAPRGVLLRNHPNPFNPVTTITYEIPEAGRVTMVIYDIAGRRVATLADGPGRSGLQTCNGTERMTRADRFPPGRTSFD